MSRAPQRRRAWPWIALASAQTLLFFLYRWLEERVYDPHAPILEPLVNEATSAVGTWTMVALVIAPFVERSPFDRQRPLVALARYGGLLAAFSLVSTSWNWGARTALYALLGLGRFDYGYMPLRYLMEFPMHLIGFSVTVVILHYMAEERRAAAARVRAAEVERALSEARLDALKLQLQPHFLFNALNTIASAMYDDVRAADGMLTHLASLLRASLQSTDRQLVPLETELTTLGHYLALLHGRFGDRCTVRIDADPALHDALVPVLVLQPLVENAVRHGNLSRVGEGTIDVTARADGDRLELVVQDDGPGDARTDGHSSGNGTGVGLRATADRLRLIHGERGELLTANANGGFRVTLRFPLVRRAA